MIKKVVRKSALVKTKKKSALVMAKKKSALGRNVAKKRLERNVRIDYSKYVSDTPKIVSKISVKKVSKLEKFIKKAIQVIKFQLNYTYRHRYNRRYNR
jgi:hypothetical protein